MSSRGDISPSRALELGSPLTAPILRRVPPASALASLDWLGEQGLDEGGPELDALEPVFGRSLRRDVSTPASDGHDQPLGAQCLNGLPDGPTGYPVFLHELTL